ncbi:MAG TPA: hypothetical protein VFY61_09780 [Pyrinomonadaceae bacterium]|nr:hypothetical protein [Pyrinomonadaceae bacterium]
MIALLSLLQDNPVTSDFDDLGKLLLGGMVAAVVVAVAIILVRFKLQDKKPPTSNFISISPPNNPGE